MLDVLAPVRSLHETPDEVLVALGLEPGEHRPHEARWFTDGFVQVHLTERTSALWRERLAFRDALRTSDELRDAYAALKLSLVEQDPRSYTDAKRPFVRDVLAAQGIAL